MIATIAKFNFERSQKLYGNQAYLSDRDRDCYDRRIHGFHMIAVIAELIFLSDHNDHSDRSNYMETRLYVFSTKHSAAPQPKEFNGEFAKRRLL